MGSAAFFQSGFFVWILLPVLIFSARICDVTISTIRIISIARGKRSLASVLGFFEVIIWLVAVGQIMKNLTNPLYYLAYGAGFAAGTYVGMFIEEKVAMGTLLIRVIIGENATQLIQFLKVENYGITSVEAQGAHGSVHIIFTIIKRRDLKSVIDIINRFNPDAFYSIEDVKYVNEGIFPIKRSQLKKDFFSLISMRRKGK